MFRSAGLRSTPPVRRPELRSSLRRYGHAPLLCNGQTKTILGDVAGSPVGRTVVILGELRLYGTARKAGRLPHVGNGVRGAYPRRNRRTSSARACRVAPVPRRRPAQRRVGL